MLIALLGGLAFAEDPPPDEPPAEEPPPADEPTPAEEPPPLDPRDADIFGTPAPAADPRDDDIFGGSSTTTTTVEPVDDGLGIDFTPTTNEDIAGKLQARDDSLTIGGMYFQRLDLALPDGADPADDIALS